MAANKKTSPSKKKRYDYRKANKILEKNKIRKLKKYLKNNPNDVKIWDRLKELEAAVNK